MGASPARAGEFRERTALAGRRCSTALDESRRFSSLAVAQLGRFWLRLELWESFPPREPSGHTTIRVQWWECHAAEATLAVDEHAFVIAKCTERVRLEPVFFSLGIVHAAPAGAVAPSAFDDAPFAEEIGGLNRIGFVGGTEDNPVAKIQREHLRLVVAQGREE